MSKKTVVLIGSQVRHPTSKLLRNTSQMRHPASKLLRNTEVAYRKYRVQLAGTDGANRSTWKGVKEEDTQYWCNAEKKTM